MKRRRRKPYASPDGLDWRNPEMPCYEKSNSRGMVIFTSKEKQDLAARRLNHAISLAPSWNQDPLYNPRGRR